MNVIELANELKDMYENAPDKEQVAFIHLFGIKRGELIKSCGYSPKEIVEASGIHKSYITEVSKGVKLSKYVNIKDYTI